MSYTYLIVPHAHTDGRPPVTLEDLSCIQAVRHTPPPEKGEIAGTLHFEVRDKLIYVRDLRVLQAERRQGVGRGLMRELDSYAASRHCGGIVITALIPAEESALFSKFLLRSGYLLPQCMECVTDVEIASIEHSYLASAPKRKSKSRLYQMDSLPAQLAFDYRTRICPHVIPACTLQQIKGTLIPELSLALAGGDEITAYTLFSELEGVLYLNGVYARKAMSTELFSLLQICLQRINQNQTRWKILRFTIMNHAGYHLGTFLFKGVRTTRQLLYQSYKLL